MTQPHPTDRANSRRRRSILTVVLVSAILATGCGSGDDADAGSTATVALADAAEFEENEEACEIVSDEVAAEVLGVEIVRREGHGDPGSGSVSCIKGTARLTDQDSDFSGMSFVSVAEVAGGAVIVDEASTQEGSQAVAGLGDRAVFLPNAGVLFIADGADEVQVQVVQAGVPGSQEDCITVANDVLERRS